MLFGNHPIFTPYEHESIFCPGSKIVLPHPHPISPLIFTCIQNRESEGHLGSIKVNLSWLPLHPFWPELKFYPRPEFISPHHNPNSTLTPQLECEGHLGSVNVIFLFDLFSFVYKVVVDCPIVIWVILGLVKLISKSKISIVTKILSPIEINIVTKRFKNRVTSTKTAIDWTCICIT